VLNKEGIPDTAEVVLSLITDEEIQRLNQVYLDTDQPTDVLAFPLVDEEWRGEDKVKKTFVAPPDGILHLGDVVVSWERAAEQAEELEHTLEKELVILTVHGVLHLLGYDDSTESERAEMEAKTNKVVEEVFGSGRN